MSKYLKVSLLVGVFLITAFAFAENGGQSTATITAIAGQPATAAALPETPAKQPAAAPAAAPKKALGITYGIDGRVRIDEYNNYNTNNMTNSLNDENGYMRLRTRLFMNVNLGRDVDGFVRLGQETWKRYATTLPACSPTQTAYCSPAGKSLTGGVPVSAQDIWFDNAYLDFKKLPIKNLSLRVGRQDIIRGDGILSLWSGEGGLGPRAGGFDAFDLAYTRGKQKFELLGIWNPMQDDYYPVINQKYPAIPFVTPSANTTYNENGTQQAIGVYYTNRALKNTDLDVYYMYAHTYDMLKLTAANNYMFQPDRHFSQLVGRVVQRFKGDFIAHGTFGFEAGTQNAMSAANDPKFGSQVFPETDIRAWAFYGFATKYFPKVKTKPYLRFVTELVSGQDPKSKTAGNYDMLFGRYTGHPIPFQENGYALPMFSDYYVNTTRQEYGANPAYYTNLKLIGVEAGFTPFQGKLRRLQFAAAYQHANAFNPFSANPVHYFTTAGVFTPGVLQAGTTAIPTYFGSGLNRYQLVKADMRFVLYKQLSGYMTVEKIMYGDFYKSAWATAAAPGGTAYRADGIGWRTELNWRFDGFLPYKRAPKA